MVIEIIVDSKDPNEILSEDDLVEIIKISCEFYGIKDEKFIEYIKDNGFKDLSNSGIDYKFVDGSFFGQITGSYATLIFYPPDKEKDEQIKKSIREYLSNKNRK